MFRVTAGHPGWIIEEGEKMTQAEHDKWERYWEESAQQDFERMIYEQCDREDSSRISESEE